VDCTPCPIGTFMRAEGGSVCRNCSTGLTTGGVGGVTCSCECAPHCCAVPQRVV
jgi:hypothetical protein